MAIDDTVTRVLLPQWLQAYKEVRLRQRACLTRIRHLNASVVRESRFATRDRALPEVDGNDTALIRNLIGYRKLMDLEASHGRQRRMVFGDETFREGQVLSQDNVTLPGLGGRKRHIQFVTGRLGLVKARSRWPYQSRHRPTTILPNPDVYYVKGAKTRARNKGDITITCTSLSVVSKYTAR